MAFGFVIERFGLFMHMLMAMEGKKWQRDASFWVGILFIVLGASAGLVSVMQYRSVLKTLKPVEIPQGYWTNVGVFVNLAMATGGIAIVGTFSMVCNKACGVDCKARLGNTSPQRQRSR